ncbi:MAG: ABC transporter substrate-binding protein [Bacteriovoracia bacterium]
MTRNFTILMTAFLAFAVATGCQKKGDGAGNAGENTLNVAIIEKIKGLDPAHASDLYAGRQVGYAYESLLDFHYLIRPYKLSPSLAEAIPTISKDGKTITFKIRKGVLFQDDPCFKATQGKGRELTAHDFVYSFKRLADPKELSEGWWIFDGRIVGLNEWADAAKAAGKADYDKPIEGLKAIDNYTLQIQLKNRSTQFLYYLAMPFSMVVPREAVEMYGADFIRNPVGTGPFRLVRNQSNLGAKLVWERNPTYRVNTYPTEGAPGDKEAGLLDDAGKRLPFVDKIVATVYVESQPMWLNFLAGKVDVSGIPKDSFAQAITPSKDLTDELKAKGMKLQVNVDLEVTHESFNMTDPLFGKNKLLRQALSYALNIEPLIEIFYNGRAIPAQGPIPPGLSGYDEKFKNPYRQFNLTKAKETLAKAGYPEGKGLPPIEYNTTSSTTARQFTEYTQKAFAEIGVKLKVNSMSWPEFNEAIKNRKGQMYGFAWSADYPDAENFLQLFYSKNMSPGPNDSNYSNPEYDKLYDQALLLADTPERTAIYKKMVAILVEDCPWIFGAHRRTYALHYGWLKNYKMHQFDHTAVKYLRVDAEARKKAQGT